MSHTELDDEIEARQKLEAELKQLRADMAEQCSELAEARLANGMLEIERDRIAKLFDASHPLYDQIFDLCQRDSAGSTKSPLEYLEEYLDSSRRENQSKMTDDQVESIMDFLQWLCQKYRVNT